jgi:hypothetical protein
MTDAELKKIKDASLQMRSVGGSSINTAQINQRYNLNYTNNIL